MAVPGSILEKRCTYLKDTIIKTVVCGYIPSELFVKPVTSKKKKTEKQNVVGEFINVMNALLNKGHGVFCIHSESAAFLDKFQEQVDNHLNSMITDGSLFDDNYERTCYFEKTFRAVYRVKPRERRAPPVNREYNTKASLDKGLADLDHYQFGTFIQKVLVGQASDDRRGSPTVSGEVTDSTPEHKNPHDKTFSFFQDQQIPNFTENHCTQAKGFKSSFHGRDYEKEENLNELVKDIWEHLFKYISAFSKNEKGGSLFYGIKEDKKGNDNPQWTQKKDLVGVEIKDKKWKLWEIPTNGFYAVSKDTPLVKEESSEYRLWEPIPSNTIPGVVEVTDSSLKLWEDGISSMYHVAREIDVPVVSEIPTGTFVCKALSLSSAQRQTLKTKLLKKVDKEMLWVGTHVPVKPVTLVFHGKDLADDLCVIEFKIKNFHGIVFTTAEGPASYTIDTTGNPPSIARMPKDEWIHSQTNNAEFKIRTPVH